MRYIMMVLLLTVALVNLNAEPVYGLSLVRKAKNNDAEAQFNLAMCYDTGLGVA
ncbi:MAG: hypothetical protein LHW57_01795 [Candidatus Cloacimonetes bacterium]|nr:hypothetical protein [Candidatus Cloacimonadota bacterium]